MTAASHRAIAHAFAPPRPRCLSLPRRFMISYHVFNSLFLFFPLFFAVFFSFDFCFTLFSQTDKSYFHFRREKLCKLAGDYASKRNPPFTLI